MKKRIKSIIILGRRWRDKVNGNTYHAARVLVDGELVAVAPFQYGYGDQWQWSGWLALVEKLKLRPRRFDNGSVESCWTYCDRHGINYTTDCSDLPTKPGLKQWAAN